MHNVGPPFMVCFYQWVISSIVHVEILPQGKDSTPTVATFIPQVSLAHSPIVNHSWDHTTTTLTFVKCFLKSNPFLEVWKQKQGLRPSQSQS